MLEQLLREMNNFFLTENGIHKGEYTVDESGSIVLSFLQNGQYFRIIGSALNDGVYQYPTSDLKPETFVGAIWALSIPRGIITLSNKIKAYIAKNGDASPYTSESFGGYSYSKATNASGVPLGWRDVFSARISAFRKLEGNYSNRKPNPRTAPPIPSLEDEL